jgi:hypothetical protein
LGAVSVDSCSAQGRAENDPAPRERAIHTSDDIPNSGGQRGQIAGGPGGEGVDAGVVVPIVGGAHLRAEVGDRPTAYALRARLAEALGDACGLVPVVLSDVWYLNDDRLRTRPTISIGAPAVNALTAHLADRVPSAFVSDGVLMVQLDVGLEDLTACCWGVDSAVTAAAVGVFCDRYLARYARALRGRAA